MTLEEAINAVYQGKMVECSKEEYENGVRSGLQEKAAKWIDSGDQMRAIITLEEIKRLDKKFL